MPAHGWHFLGGTRETEVDIGTLGGQHVQAPWLQHGRQSWAGSGQRAAKKLSWCPPLQSRNEETAVELS